MDTNKTIVIAVAAVAIIVAIPFAFSLSVKSVAKKYTNQGKKDSNA